MYKGIKVSSLSPLTGAGDSTDVPLAGSARDAGVLSRHAARDSMAQRIK